MGAILINQCESFSKLIIREEDVRRVLSCVAKEDAGPASILKGCLIRLETFWFLNTPVDKLIRQVKHVILHEGLN